MGGGAAGWELLAARPGCVALALVLALEPRALAARSRGPALCPASPTQSPPPPPLPAAGSPLPFGRRRAFFSSAGNRTGRCFEPGPVWTFYFYQHLVDLSTYTLHMVFKRVMAPPPTAARACPPPPPAPPPRQQVPPASLH